MPNFEHHHQSNPKEKEGYLSQIAANLNEKIGEITNAITNNLIPKTPDGQLKILELGPGGGESIEYIKNEFNNRRDISVFAADISVGVLKRAKRKHEVESIASDAVRLPFKNNTFSAINASAVFHEVSSYGSFENIYDINTKKLRGLEAVKQALLEAQRVLLPGGALTYRDVFCPDKMFEETTVNYCNSAWKYFAKWFYPDFLEANRRGFSRDNQPKIAGGDNEPTQITATRHLHRELQRHYLMLRDYLRTQLAINIGLRVIEESWVDKDAGKKMHEFDASGILLKIINQGIETSEHKRCSMQSEEYDKLFDKFIENIMKQEAGVGSPFGVELSEWKKREGKEIYTYASIRDMLNLVCENSATARDGYIIFPKTASDIRVLPRNYYNRYLREVIDRPEFDGKQIINFYKITCQDALQVIDGLKKLTSGTPAVNTHSLREKIEALI